MNNPKVTIFMPTFARYGDGFLQRAVESALRQTWQNFELLVVDDGSVDGSQDYLSALSAEDMRVKHIRLAKNTGLPAYALAQAYPYATGDYFAWLFDDCELQPDHLDTLVGRLREEPELGMVYAQARAQLANDRSFVIGSPIDIEAMRQGYNSIPNACVVLPRGTIEKVGWYDPHIILKRLCDWDLWLRIAAEFKIGFVEKILATEFGVGLPGSLGRLNKDNSGLAHGYARTSRNHRLAPTDLSLSDAYRTDIGLPMEPSTLLVLEQAILEHQLFTMDVVGAISTAERMISEGLLEATSDRLRQQGATTGDYKTDSLFAATVNYLRKRIEENAASMIQMEVAGRDALRAADQRMEDMTTALGQLTAAQAQRDEFAAAVVQLQERINAHESHVDKSTAERFDDQLARELTEAKYSLFIFRDAADRRLEIIRVLEEKLSVLTTQSDELVTERKKQPATRNPSSTTKKRKA